MLGEALEERGLPALEAGAHVVPLARALSLVSAGGGFSMARAAAASHALLSLLSELDGVDVGKVHRISTPLRAATCFLSRRRLIPSKAALTRLTGLVLP